MKDLIAGILEDLIDDFNSKFKSHDELMEGIKDATNRIVLIAEENFKKQPKTICVKPKGIRKMKYISPITGGETIIKVAEFSGGYAWSTNHIQYRIDELEEVHQNYQPWKTIMPLNEID